MSSKPCVAGKTRKHEVLVRGNVHVVAEALPVEPAVPAHRLVHERGGGSVRRPGGDCRGGRPDDGGDHGDGGDGDDYGVGSGEDGQPLMVSRRHCFVCGKTKRVVLAQLGGELLHWTPHCVIRRA